jgi:hypothetical protein
MQRAIRASLSALLMILAGCAVSLRAQQVQGSFTGTVTDQSGALVPGVTVTATEVDTGLTRSSVTQEDGSYTIPLLPPGHYRLMSEKMGFEKTVQGPVTLLVDTHPRVDFQVKVGLQTTTVTVESTAPVLDTQTYSVGTTVEQTKISQLPFNGRHFLEATLFTPGVVPGSQGSELNDNRGGSINVNGMRETMNTFLLDGMSNTSIAVGTLGVAGLPAVIAPIFGMNTLGTWIGSRGTAITGYVGARTDLGFSITSMQDVTTGDFNGDGLPDVAAVDTNAGVAMIWTGNTDGTLSLAGMYATGAGTPGPVSVASADMNGDGKLDLVVANSHGNTVAVLLGNGNGTFQPALETPVGTAPMDLVVSDFNGDEIGRAHV